MKDARDLDPSITLQDITKWKECNVERRTQLKGYNSFIPKEPYDEYQLDYFCMSDLHDQYIKVALLMVAIFKI